MAALIAEVLPYTAALALASMLVALALALPLGVLAAVRRGSGWDKSASTLAMLGHRDPATSGSGRCWCSRSAVELRVLPLPGDDPTRLLRAGSAGADRGRRAGRDPDAPDARRADRGAVRAVHPGGARARRAAARRCCSTHALRNALLPVMTVAAAQLGALLSGAVIAEKIFERPGLGTLFLEAFFDRDIPVVQGCVLVIAVVYVVVNLVIDLLYGVIDPRVRLS